MVAQERDHGGKFRRCRLLKSIMDRILIPLIFLQHERGLVSRRLRHHRSLLAHLRRVHFPSWVELIKTVRVGSGLVGHWIVGRVLTEELRVGESGVGELGVIVGWAVEELTVVVMTVVVVLGALYVEVTEPPQLSIHIPILLQHTILRKPRPFCLILFKRVYPSLLWQLANLLILSMFRWFIKKLLKIRSKVTFITYTVEIVISVIPLRGPYLVTLIPFGVG